MYKAPTMTTHDVASHAGVRRRCRHLLAVDGVMSAHVTASSTNEAAKLPGWSAMMVDDFHCAVPAVSGNMIDLVDRQLAFFISAVRARRAHRGRTQGPGPARRVISKAGTGRSR
jgi:hypothetical protein